MNVVAIVQARMGSTRLPGKVKMDVGGTMMVDRVLYAASRIEGVSQAVVAWAEGYPDLDENDVLGRYARVAKHLHADVIMRLTSDCPLFDPQVGALVLQHFMVRSERPCYVSNVFPRRTFPDGLDCEVFDRLALQDADIHATDPNDREHVGPYMQRHWCRDSVELPVDWSHVRLTVDTEEDLAWIRTLIQGPKSGVSAPSP